MHGCSSATYWLPVYCANLHSIQTLSTLHMCRAAAEQFHVKPGTVPQLFDKPEFFDKIAERSQLSGQSPDLLFFAFYYQPVSLLFAPMLSWFGAISMRAMT